jgi:4-hydroxy-tetrahydrodipicolinate synthase
MIAAGSPMPSASLQGVVPALITPLDPDGHVDEASVASLVEFQLAAGVHGLLALGSTGEGPLLSVEDKLRMVRSTVSAARGRVPVMVGIAHSSPAESVAFGNQAHQAGANALVTTPPFYFLSTQAELLDYYRYIRARIELPLITYDVPSAVKTRIAAPTVRALAEEGLIIGIKDSSGDLAGFRELLIATQHLPHFHALTGSERFLDAAMLVGGHGGVLGLASIIPELYVEIYEAARTGEWAQANQLQQRAIAALHMIHVGPSSASLTAGAIGSFKVALRDMGVIRHATVSNPLLPLDDDAIARVREIMARVGIQSPVARA